MMRDAPPETLLVALRPLRAGGGVAVAFSGGSDSAALLAALAHLRRSEGGFPLVALTADSPLQTRAEVAAAGRLAAALGVPWRAVPFAPLGLPEVAANAPGRCLACKRALFRALRAAAPAAALLDGTNAEDLTRHRPGLAARAEAGVRSPLAECGLAKADCRALAAALGVPMNLLAPPAPCLATRFSYGTALTPAALDRVARAEALLRGLLPEIQGMRLRDHGDVARVEIPPAAFPRLLACRETLIAGLRPLGYRHVTLDLAGFRSGSFDV